MHVIASLLAGAENCPDSELEGREEFKRELKYAEKQTRAIEKWARIVNVWYVHRNEHESAWFWKR